MSILTWNGVASNTLGVTVEQRAAIPVAARRYTVVSVPGRNGDIIIPDGSYSNYTISYQIHLSAESGNLAEKAHAVANWLGDPDDYCKLVDDQDPDIYRLAYFTGPSNISNILQRHGQATISFSCQPKCFYTDSVSFTYNSSTHKFTATFNNTSGHYAYPVIKIKRTNLQDGTYQVKIGSNAVEFPFSEEEGNYGSITVDCENQSVQIGYTTSLHDLEYTITGDDFPFLYGGSNTITIYSSVFDSSNSIEIDVRRWTL